MPKQWDRMPEQEKYLNGLLQGLIQARLEKRIERFKHTLYDGWFELWPEENEVFGKDWKKGDPMTRDDMRVLGAAIEKRKEQLYNYVRWHTNGKVVRSIRTSSSGVLKNFINKEKKTSKRSRKIQKLELYSQKYYETRFKDQVEQEILDTTPPNESKSKYQKRKMTIYRKWRSLAWQMESDEVKTEIDTAWNEKNATAPAGPGEVDEDDDPDAEGELDPGENPSAGGYGGCVDELGELLTSFLRELQDETGWAFTILGGGLNREGEVKLVTSHVGKTAAGNTFPQVCNGYHENILQEFLTFVKVRHPVEERLLCAQVSNERKSSASSQNLKETSRTSADDKPEGTPSQHMETSRTSAIDVVSERDPTPSHMLPKPNYISFSTQDTLVMNPSMRSHNTVSAPLPENMASLLPLQSTNFTSAMQLTANSAGGHSAPTTSGPILFPDVNCQWMSYYNPLSVSTPMMPQETLPYENLSPMSKFLIATDSHEPADNSAQAASVDSSESMNFFNPINIPSATTSTPATSALMNTSIINPAPTNNPSVYLPIPAPSFPNPVPPYSDSNLHPCPSLDTMNSAIASNYSGSLFLPNAEPEDRASTEINTTANNDQEIAMSAKPRSKRARKDEVNISFVLPDGATRVHKPRRLGDETCWEGLVPKRSRRKRI